MRLRALLPLRQAVLPAMNHQKPDCHFLQPDLSLQHMHRVSLRAPPAYSAGLAAFLANRETPRYSQLCAAAQPAPSAESSTAPSTSLLGRLDTSVAARILYRSTHPRKS